MPDGAQRDARETIGDQRRLALAPRRQGPIDQTMLGILVLAVSNEVDEVRQPRSLPSKAGVDAAPLPAYVMKKPCHEKVSARR